MKENGGGNPSSRGGSRFPSPYHHASYFPGRADFAPQFGGPFGGPFGGAGPPGPAYTSFGVVTQLAPHDLRRGAFAGSAAGGASPGHPHGPPASAGGGGGLGAAFGGVVYPRLGGAAPAPTILAPGSAPAGAFFRDDRQGHFFAPRTGAGGALPPAAHVYGPPPGARDAFVVADAGGGAGDSAYTGPGPPHGGPGAAPARSGARPAAAGAPPPDPEAPLYPGLKRPPPAAPVDAETAEAHAVVDRKPVAGHKVDQLVDLLVLIYSRGSAARAKEDWARLREILDNEAPLRVAQAEAALRAKRHLLGAVLAEADDLDAKNGALAAEIAALRDDVFGAKLDAMHDAIRWKEQTLNLDVIARRCLSRRDLQSSEAEIQDQQAQTQQLKRQLERQTAAARSAASKLDDAIHLLKSLRPVSSAAILKEARAEAA